MLIVKKTCYFFALIEKKVFNFSILSPFTFNKLIWTENHLKFYPLTENFHFTVPEIADIARWNSWKIALIYPKISLFFLILVTRMCIKQFKLIFALYTRYEILIPNKSLLSRNIAYSHAISQWNAKIIIFFSTFITKNTLIFTFRHQNHLPIPFSELKWKI